MSAKAQREAVEREYRFHEVYGEALTARDALETAFSHLAEQRDKRRDLESRLQDREQEVASEEWGKHPDMPVTRMEKHLKGTIRQDDDCRELREQLGGVQFGIDQLEGEIKVLQADVSIAAARLQEVGGMLTFLAAITKAGSSKRSEETGETS